MITDSLKDTRRRFFNLDWNENENKTCQNFRGRMKAVLREKHTCTKCLHKIVERSQINNLMMHLKVLEKKDQPKPKISS